MNFDYRTLRSLELNGERLGSWSGRPVFASSSGNLNEKGSGAFYVLYDDENKIVGRDGNRWYSYGTVSESGSVSEYASRRSYNVSKPQTKKEEPVKTESLYTPGYETEEHPVGDVKLEIDVEATLKRAREMTIDDLLVGFNMGVEAVG
jgi:hypothetical protein